MNELVDALKNLIGQIEQGHVCHEIAKSETLQAALDQANQAVQSSAGKVLVPVNPDVALLASMATCRNHGFGIMDYREQQRMIDEMRKLHDEVVGNGYYKKENRNRYLGVIAKELKAPGI